MVQKKAFSDSDKLHFIPDIEFDDDQQGKEIGQNLVVEMNPEEVVFNINVVPGAPEDVDLEGDIEERESLSEDEVSEEEENEEEETDEWHWEKSHGLIGFLKWVKGMLDNIPTHSGKITTGIERVIPYLGRINKEII